MYTTAPIVVVAPTFHSAFHTRICDFLGELIGKSRMQMRKVTDAPAVQDAALRFILSQLAPSSSVIAISVRPSARVVDAYRKAGVPIVLIDEEAPGVSTVSNDNFYGGLKAGEHLLKIGRRRFAVVCGRRNVAGGYNAVQRVAGIQMALAKRDLHLASDNVIEVMDYSTRDGVEAMERLMTHPIDAIFCAAGDTCAAGMVRRAKELRVKIPADIAIVGYDDLPMAQLVTPQLTTIRQPLSEIASLAYKLAVTDRETASKKPQKVAFKPDLVLRQSA